MDLDLVNKLAKRLHQNFPDKSIVHSIRDEIVVVGAVSALTPVIDTEINAILSETGIEYKLRKGQLVWTIIKNDLVVYLSPNLSTYKIIEAHWSTDKADSHQVDDADSTYAVIDANGQRINIFKSKSEAEEYVKRHKFE